LIATRHVPRGAGTAWNEGDALVSDLSRDRTYVVSRRFQQLQDFLDAR
jgi:hypothetical protein